MNTLVSQVMSGVTGPFRFPFSIPLNCDLRRIQANMVPFPRLHFLLMSQSPLKNEGNKSTFEKFIQNSGYFNIFFSKCGRCSLNIGFEEYSGEL